MTTRTTPNPAKTLDQYGDLLSAKELSEILGISKQTTYKEIKKGTFGKPWKLGREYRIPKLYIIDNIICSQSDA